MSLLLRAFPLTSLCSKSLPLFRAILKPFSKTLPRNRVAFSVSVSASTHIPNTKSSLSLPNNSLEWVSRTGFYGELSEADLGKWVRLCGWVALHRVHGGLIFLNLRDHTGIIQADAKFGYLLEALDMVAPPHGGIAYGLDD